MSRKLLICIEDCHRYQDGSLSPCTIRDSAGMPCAEAASHAFWLAESFAANRIMREYMTKVGMKIDTNHGGTTCIAKSQVVPKVAYRASLIPSMVDGAF